MSKASERVTNRVRTGDIQNHNLAAHNFNGLQAKQLRQGESPLVPMLVPANRKSEEIGDSNTVACIPKAKPDETDFAAALLMLAKLPLSDDDRAEAIRRLLCGT